MFSRLVATSALCCVAFLSYEGRSEEPAAAKRPHAALGSLTPHQGRSGTSAPSPFLTAASRKTTLRLREVPDDPPAAASVLSRRTVSAPAIVMRGPFTSVQVNVNAMGNNVVGDAANEPSIAVDPTNPDKMAIAWRQFDTIASNFRQAGNAFSTDGGQTWTFPGVLDPGQFRSDPVLASDPDGVFYFSSLQAVDAADVFKSTDGGMTWGLPVSAFGGDKQWIAVDRTNGIGRGNVYQIWNVQFSCCGLTDFTRSTDGGVSFDGPFALPDPRIKWGTMDVGADGTLYVAGATLDQSSHLFTKSVNAQDPAQTPAFAPVQAVFLGGVTGFSGGFAGPNPAGLLGQVWIATDHSSGPTAGNLYILASVTPPGSDPLDVMFIRSTDGGQTWSDPLRVNDDASGNDAFQWFGTLAVAPNGRIDVVFNDTRNTGQPNLSELFYTFSLDGGLTWAANVPVSPVFNSHLGFPNQNKIGDYYDMISDNGGANLAYAATFNGEQDVYFLRIPADCNNNGIPDDQDIAAGAPDCNGNEIPDECEPAEDCNNNGTQDICDIASGVSDDCNNNQVPDDCEPAEDCNANGTVDICDIGDGTSLDCNDNAVPDECDITSGTSRDDNADGVPDECQGACCLCTTCLDLSRAACGAQGGEFAGNGVLCQDASCPILLNDDCVNAEPLPSAINQTVPFDNRCAVNDGPLSVVCDNGTQPFGADIWYQYVAPCDGDLTVSLCNNTNYDAIMAIYGGGAQCECPFQGAPQLACSDDSCGIGGGPPIITIPVTGGRCYTIRVAGWNASTGTGEMNLALSPSGAGPDCQPNGIPDECDIGSGTSSDVDGNGVPDECECLTVSPPQSEPAPVAKNRYLSFDASPILVTSALQVTLISSAGFPAAVGSSWWVGPPQTFCENSGQAAEPPEGCSPAGGGPLVFTGAELRCTPHCANWADLGVVHVFGRHVVPDASYEVRAIHCGCDLGNPAFLSTPLPVPTAPRWADVCGPGPAGACSGPPDGSVDVQDSIGLVDTFENRATGLAKARADLSATDQGDPVPDQQVTVTEFVNWIDGFGGAGFPFAGPVACP